MIKPEAKPIPDGQWDDVPGFNVGKEEYVRLDTEAWLRDHRIREEGRERGEKNFPPSDAGEPDDVHYKMLSWIALGQVRAGRPERMRSLYGPVPPDFAGAGFGPTPADRLVAFQSSPGPVPRAVRRFVRVVRTGAFCSLHKGPMPGLGLLFGLDSDPSHRLAPPADRPLGGSQNCPDPACMW